MSEAANLPQPDTTRVMGLVESSSQYVLVASEGSMSQNGMSYESHDDKNECVLVPQAIDVQFTATFPNGTQRLVIFTVAENLTRLEKVTVMQPFYGFPTGYQTLWSGYELYALNGGGSMFPQLEATGLFYQPSVAWPGLYGSGQPNCIGGTTPCDLLTWSGLTPCMGGCNPLFQQGSLASVSCGAVGGCTPATYYMFYEVYPSTATVCTGSSATISSGDSIESYVYSATIVGGSSGQWYQLVKDNTNGNTCSPTNPVSNSFTPYYAEFELEHPVNSLATTYLAYFSQFNMEGRMYYNGATQAINIPYSNSWGTNYIMDNSGYQNIAVSSITSTGTGWGQFTSTWLTSQGT